MPDREIVQRRVVREVVAAGTFPCEAQESAEVRAFDTIAARFPDRLFAQGVFSMCQSAPVRSASASILFHRCIEKKTPARCRRFDARVSSARQRDGAAWRGPRSQERRKPPAQSQSLVGAPRSAIESADP